MRTYYPITWRSDRQRFHIFISVSFLASLMLHLAVFLTLKDILLMPPGFLIVQPPDEGVRLEFVDSPERILPPPDEPRDTNLISDQASLPQDVIPDKTELTEMPRAAGTTKEKSIRQVPAGKPAELEEPRRETAADEPEPITNAGISVGEKIGKESLESLRQITLFQPESPFLLEGKDEFLSPESDIPDGKTKILKQIAYNVKSTAVGEYLSRLKPRVVNAWHLEVMSNTFYVRSEKTTILFKILPDGSLDEITVATHEGPEIEMIYGLNAIEKAQPFEPLTEDILNYIKDEGLWLEFNFYYH